MTSMKTALNPKGTKRIVTWSLALWMLFISGIAIQAQGPHRQELALTQLPGTVATINGDQFRLSTGFSSKLAESSGLPGHGGQVLSAQFNQHPAFTKKSEDGLNSIFRSKITAINGNTIECEGGVTASIASASLYHSAFRTTSRSELTVGTHVWLNGKFVTSPQGNAYLDAGYCLIETDTTMVIRGIVQKVDAKNQTLTILNQTVKVSPQADIQNVINPKKLKLSSFKPGHDVFIGGEVINGTLVANSLVLRDKPKDPDDGEGYLIGTIRELNNDVARFDGGFVFDVSKFNAANAPLLNLQAGRRMEVDFNFDDVPTTAAPIKVENGVLPQDLDHRLFGLVQDVNAATSMVTVFNQSLMIPDGVFLFFPPLPQSVSQLTAGQDFIGVSFEITDAGFVGTSVWGYGRR